jgi:hypothetical protein
MNTSLLEKHLENYRKMLDDDTVKRERQERKERVTYYQSWTHSKISNMNDADFEEYIGKLWAMLIWGNKKYKTDQILNSNGFEKVKKELAGLIWGKRDLSQRWDRFKKEIKGFGPAMISELLCMTHPDEYMLWNRRAYVALNYLDVKSLPKYDYQLDGKKYKELCDITKEIGSFMAKSGFKEVDLLFVDYFIWEELQVEEYLSRIHKKENKQESKDISLKDVEKRSGCVHDDIKEKIAEIGQWLGFTTALEKKVADGAVVDTIWEATIGNMGRVIYVFEVQTSGSIDSLLMNLLKSLNNPAVQGVVAVSDAKQLEKINKHVASIQGLRDKLKLWNYEEVLANHEALSLVNESINKLKLVPQGF